MAEIRNLELNVCLSIELVDNEFMLIDKDKSDFENWISFVLKLNIDDKSIGYGSEDEATFTVYEVKNLIKIIDELICSKRTGKNISRTEISSSEAFFDLIFDETYEENQVYIEFWINSSIMSKGVKAGYDEGFRFVATIDGLEAFKDNILYQFNNIMQND